MSEVLRMLLVIAGALAVSAASVFGLRDRYVLTPPPESAVEGFLDQFTVRRHAQALRRVALGVQGATEDSLAARHRELRARIGKFELESPRRLGMTSDRAIVAATLKGEGSRSATLTFPLVRDQHGVWRLVDLTPLAHPSS